MHDPDPLIAMLNRLKLTVLRDQLDNQIDEPEDQSVDLVDTLPKLLPLRLYRRFQCSQLP